MAHKKYAFVIDAPITTILVLLYAAAHALDAFLRGRIQFPDGQTLIPFIFSCSTINLHDPLDYLRLISHVLGSDGWASLLGNALLMLLLGQRIEERASAIPFAIMLLLSALVSGVLTCLVPSLRAQGPDPLIAAMLLLNFLICLQDASISCSWILAILAFIALRSYAIIGPDVPEGPVPLLKECLPLFISLAGGIAGCLPAFLLLPKAGGRRTAKAKAKAKKDRGGSYDDDDDATVVGTIDL